MYNVRLDAILPEIEIEKHDRHKRRILPGHGDRERLTLPRWLPRGSTVKIVMPLRLNTNLIVIHPTVRSGSRAQAHSPLTDVFGNPTSLLLSYLIAFHPAQTLVDRPTARTYPSEDILLPSIR